jgi:DNA-binding XRE family transcriptional regulator
MENPMKRLRSKTGLSRPKFALKTGLSARTVENVETGCVQKVSAETALLMQEYCGEAYRVLQAEYLEWKNEQLQKEIK